MPEPMPISWLSPVTPKPQGVLLRHVGGGALGLAMGLALLVPIVLWQKGRIDPAGSATRIATTFGLAAAAPPAAPEAVRRETSTGVPRTVKVPVEVINPVPTAPVSASVAVIKPVPVEVVTAQNEAAKSEALLEDARRLIGEGDFRAARSMLEDQAISALPTARFLLAETYDPNFLAARGVRSVRAEVPRAIELYRLALDGGIDAARQRINALRP